ncbi:monooxygenase [Shewanella eurypsychrophilus]|uniref:Monooxygenase n=1 Tax=Shewanella eurypsychrophilus TaxID=2593656 RepID=A0ABX6V586_9GAMM|nr:MULTISPECIES: monooxygenase [Shewanella]QFU22510.1 monooxygenase [Shewanella sp. YLB-09]QPG57798.1 monooxygenase [Shewanella eurypsychrophilus]
MQKLLQVDFGFNGPFGDEMATMLTDLAKSINNEPGMIWKIWTESESKQLGGGVYLFEDETSAQAYLEMHTARLNEMGITDVRGLILDINQTLSKLNHAPLAQK